MNARTGFAAWRTSLLVATAVAIVALAIGLAVAPKAIMQGWLIAFVFVSGIPIGSLVLLLIHRLTGGRWGPALAPVLLPAASMVPFVALIFIPLAFGLSGPYHWASEATLLRPQVAHIYFNQPAFLLRSTVALIGWSVFSVFVVRRHCTSLMAALGLVFHVVMMSLVAVDWILSVDSNFSSSAFAASLMIQQLLSALALAALFGAGGRDGRAVADLGGLLIATLLGTLYLDLMSFIVIWYGNLPEKAAWYLARERDGWQWVILAAIATGALAPFCLLLKQSVRQAGLTLHVIGGLILFGVLLHVVWLIAPAFGSGAVVTAMIAVIATVGLGIGAVDRFAARLAGAAYVE
jgi:hypothetical protein